MTSAAQQHPFLILNEDYSLAKLSSHHRAVLQTSVWSLSLRPAARPVSQAGNGLLRGTPQERLRVLLGSPP